MNEMQIFENPEFGEVRTVEIDGEPWLVGKDVARALGYSNTKDALSRHVDPEDKRQDDGVVICDPMGREQHPTIINESGLYSLVLSSKLPGAKRFKRWVTAEVLPSIRKHGAYMTPETIERTLLDPDFIIRLAQRLKEEQAENRLLRTAVGQQEIELSFMRPKAEYFDALVDANLLTSLRETAKLLHTGEKALVRYLLEHRYLYRGQTGKLLPYATRSDGLFEVKEAYDPRSGWRGTQTYVTPRGRETLRLLMLGEGSSKLWGAPQGEPRALTEKEKAECETYYRRQARREREKGKG